MVCGRKDDRLNEHSKVRPLAMTEVPEGNEEQAYWRTPKIVVARHKGCAPTRVIAAYTHRIVPLLCGKAAPFVEGRLQVIGGNRVIVIFTFRIENKGSSG
jgi:hypothetical protein